MEAAEAGKRVVRPHADALGLEALAERVEVVDDEPRMRLAGRDERLLDADVKLRRADAKPATAACRERRRLRHLLEPEQLAVERARGALAARRRGDLHVVDARDAHGARFTIARVGGVQPRLEDSLVTGYRRLASDAPHRRIDFELRVLDIAFASVLGLLLLPVVAVIALLLRVTCGAPILYRGQRVGRGGRFFEMLKFRTLRTGAEERIGRYLGEELVRRTESELTSLGRWLKSSQLDEIPQLWNVLRGDMSFVGPRPIRPRFFAELATELPAYWQRLVIRPGLTGFAQVRRGYETSMADKLAHDLEWIADRSVPLYLRTLVVTALRVLRQTVRPRATLD